MIFDTKQSSVSVSRRVMICLTSLMFLIIAPPVAAQPRPVVIRDNPGGAIVEFLRQVQALTERGVPVEIRGRYCLSACTLYLGSAIVCVDPETWFGFHGPQSGRFGIGLTGAEFARWSVLMANQYPAPIRDWFLATGRNRTIGFYYFRGADLITLGVRKCPDAETG